MSTVFNSTVGTDTENLDGSVSFTDPLVSRSTQKSSSIQSNTTELSSILESVSSVNPSSITNSSSIAGSYTNYSTLSRVSNTTLSKTALPSLSSSSSSSSSNPVKSTIISSSSTSTSTSTENETSESSSDVVSTVVVVANTETAYPAPTTTAVPLQTIFYSQPYQITGSETTIMTELPATTVIDATETFDAGSQQTITKDFNFLAAYAQDHGSSSSTSSDTPSSRARTATIAGSLVGSLVGVSLIIFLLWFFLKRRNSKKVDTIEKRSFSHAISSTRRYDGTSWNFDEDENEKQEHHSSPFSFIHNFGRQKTDSSEESPNTSLNSIKSSILQSQTFKPIIPTRSPFTSFTRSNNRRTIDTVFEDSELESSSYLCKQEQPSTSSQQPRRYQNSGLKINPFDNATQRYTTTSKSVPPTPPPSRKNNSKLEDYHRHGNNRASITSVESSIMSEDSNDDISTDDSLIQFGESNTSNMDSSSRGGFFREVV